MKTIKQKRPKLQIRGYKLIYTDTKAGGGDMEISGRLLRCPKYELSGKPDFIFARRKRFIPVELKSGKLGEATEPRRNDLMQLICYFFLIQSEFGIKVRKAHLLYGDTMFVIKNYRNLRNEFLTVLAEMREMLEAGESFINVEKEYTKCRYCVCRETVCGVLDS
ncbi:MAG: CRISPR-associated protein Cas4 [Defluviitaleaceae bacterium]|nr:CRISPR-associated protein Cas4 [Defluviitaleaceae bacterium]